MIEYDLIFDVSNMFHRSYSIYKRQIPDFDFDNQKHNDMMVRKFVIDSISITKLFNMGNLFFCFDDNSFRKIIDPGYKNRRGPKQAGFQRCLDEIYNLLKFKKLNALKVHGLEADDCIALLNEKRAHVPKILVSADDDIKQLIQPRTMVLTPVKATRTLYKSFYTVSVHLPELKDIPVETFMPHYLLTEKLLKGCDGDDVQPLVPKGFRSTEIVKIADNYMRQKMNHLDTELNSFVHACSLSDKLNLTRDQIERQLHLVCLQSQFMPPNLVKEFDAIPLTQTRFIEFEVTSILGNTRYWNEDYKKEEKV